MYFQVWAAGYLGISAVRVCMIDTGIDYTHPDIAGNMWINSVEAAGANANAGDGYQNGIDDDGNSESCIAVCIALCIAPCIVLYIASCIAACIASCMAACIALCMAACSTLCMASRQCQTRQDTQYLPS